MQAVVESPVSRINGRWVWVPDQEEIPTTFQVGITASDGVILASDRCAIFAPTLAHEHPYRSSHRGSKIFASDDFACCPSGTGWAVDAAYRAVELHRGGVRDVSECLYHSRAEAIEVARVAGYDPHTNLGALLVAHRSANRVDLWFADVRVRIGNIPSDPIRMDDYKSAGDNGNGAHFLIERYLRRQPQFRMEQLKLLTAHAILTAAQLNPEGIEGLEILLCPNIGPFRAVGREELEDLSRRSAEVDESFRRQFLSTHL